MDYSRLFRKIFETSAMELNPGFLGISEIRIPVPWGHISAKVWGQPPTTGSTTISPSRVLAVHGWCDNAGTFDTLIPLLPKSLYIVAIDAPGHGHSSHLPPGIPYHYIDLVSSIRRVVRFLKWTKFSYMGHSMGASLGIMYASLYPDEVENLVLLDLVRPITNPSHECGAGIRGGVAPFLIYDELQASELNEPICYSFEVAVERLMKFTVYSHYPLTESSAKTLLIRGTRRVSETEWTYNRDQRMMSNSILRFSHEQLYDMLNRLKCHMLMIKATEASWYQPKDIYLEAIEIYKKVCASYNLVQVSGNHFVHLIHPQRLSKQVAEFLGRPRNCASADSASAEVKGQRQD